MAAPTVLPYPLTRLIDPAGKPALDINSHIFNAPNGVVSADLITTVLPHANAGAIFLIGSQPVSYVVSSMTGQIIEMA